MPGASADTGLIIGLCAGLGGGALLVVIAGTAYIFETKRRRRLARDACVERANAERLAQAPLDRVVDDHGYADHYAQLYSIPTDDKSSELNVLRAHQRKSNESLDTEDDVRYPSIVADYAEKQSAEPRRSVHMSASAPVSRRTTLSGHSLRAKMTPRASISRLPSLLPHSKSPHIGRRRTMLRHIPTLRSLGERHPPRAGSAESIHADDNGQIPMARRIAKRESRFTYEGSSPSEQLHLGNEWSAVEPIAEHAYETPDVAVPEPAVLPAEDRGVRNSLYDRIFEWQSHNQDVMESGNGGNAGDEEAQVPVVLRPASALGRSGSQRSSNSSAYSAMSHSTLENVIGPYFGAGSDGLLRAPSIRPQFAAETTLDSWLVHDDPRRAHTPSSGHDIFGEVELASAQGTSEAHGQLGVQADPAKRTSNAYDQLLTPVSARLHLTGANPSPRSHLSTSDTSRSSMPLSQSKRESQSTDLTWPSEGSALPEKDDWRRSARLSGNAADRIAQANRDWGVGSTPPRIPEMPSSAPLALFSGDDYDFDAYGVPDDDADESEAVGYAIDPTEEDLGFDSMPNELRNSRVLFGSAHSHSSASSDSCDTNEAPASAGVDTSAFDITAAKDTSVIPLSPWLAHEPGAWAAVDAITT